MATTVKHPDYPSLNIIIAKNAADKPIPGNFFVTHQTVNLSDVAYRAYGPPTGGATFLTITKRINRSKYNMQKCFYRYKSDDCYSSRVSSAGAPNTNNWGPGAWLSLCNVDKAGVDGLGLELETKYQIFWIPPVDGKEPWDLDVPKTQPDIPAQTPSTPDINVVIPPSLPSIPDIDIHIGGDEGGGETVTEYSKVCSDGTVLAWSEGQQEPVCPEAPPKKAGVGWILAAVLGVGAIGAVVYLAGKGKKGKRGKR